MNYLAHIYLSGTDTEIMLGNFMADSIKGHQYEIYPEKIKKGILLHRKIDSFTDSHPIYRQSKHRLHEKYGHYSGVIMDIFYDHFLAKNWNKYNELQLENYAQNFYEILISNQEKVTERIRKMMPYMIARNWLVSYKTISGIEQILFQMNYKTHHRVPMTEAIVELEKFYTEFEIEFFEFFDEIRAMSNEFLNQ